MGALTRPGPQLGSKGPPPPRSGTQPPQPFGAWFASFLRDELRPYPGRAMLVTRMTLAATLTMLVVMTFRLPGAAIAGYYTLLLSRESPITTVRSAGTVLSAYLAGAAYTLVGAMLFVDYPLTHFLWVTGSVFLCFFVIKVTTDYVGAAAFAFIITIAVPSWDAPLPTALLVTATLWAAGSVAVGLLCTIAVEYVLAGFRPRDELHAGLVRRVSALSQFLRSLADAEPSGGQAGQQVQQLAMVGVSRLRRLAASASSSNTNPERRSTIVALVGRAVDLAATLQHLPPTLDESGRQRLLRMAAQFGALESSLGRPIPHTRPVAAAPPGENPLLNELDRTLTLLELSLASPAAESPIRLNQAPPASSPSLLPDAFTNPEHLLFSLRGCLAAMLCYVIFNAVAWRGLSTSLATCVVTALTSVGSSRQKQVLRISGAVVGGLFFGIGSQVLILPMLDSIAGFTVLFVVVTMVSAWISTSSPRLSYFGQQIALAFYLIHLQEFFPQTNLAVARDRVMGVGLGLVMMWLVFDTLGTRPAAVVMRDLFATNLRLLAQLSRPWQDGAVADLNHLRSLRDRISSNFASVNSQADAVLFELGPTRQRDLQLRERLLSWQPRLRSLFLIEIALLQYRTQTGPHEIAPAIVKAQEQLDQKAFSTLEHLADAFARRRPPIADPGVISAYEELERTIYDQYNGHPTDRALGVLTFSLTLAELLDNFSRDLAHTPRL